MHSIQTNSSISSLYRQPVTYWQYYEHEKQILHYLGHDGLSEYTLIIVPASTQNPLFKNHIWAISIDSNFVIATSI